LSGAERRALVDRKATALPLTVQTQLLGISRSSLYYMPRQPSAEEVALKHRIDAIYTQYPFYGSRRITAQLQREGRQVNRKAVRRHMRDTNLGWVVVVGRVARSARR
jgi:putative transposase